MEHNGDLALRAINNLLDKREKGILPHIIVAMDVRREIARLLKVSVDDRQCDGPMRAAMGTLRMLWA